MCHLLNLSSISRHLLGHQPLVLGLVHWRGLSSVLIPYQEERVLMLECLRALVFLLALVLGWSLAGWLFPQT